TLVQVWPLGDSFGAEAAAALYRWAGLSQRYESFRFQSLFERGNIIHLTPGVLDKSPSSALRTWAPRALQMIECLDTCLFPIQHHPGCRAEPAVVCREQVMQEPSC